MIVADREEIRVSETDDEILSSMFRMTHWNAQPPS